MRRVASLVLLVMIGVGQGASSALAETWVTPPGYYPVPKGNPPPGCYYSGCHAGVAASDPKVNLIPSLEVPLPGQASANDTGLWRYKIDISGNQYCYNWATVRNTDSNGWAMAWQASKCYLAAAIRPPALTRST